MKPKYPERLIDVKLYGHLRARFGRVYRFAIRTPAEAVRALCVCVPGFRQYLQANSEPGYRVVVDKEPIDCKGSERRLYFGHGLKAIKIVPVVAGAAGGGKIILGAALIGLSFLGGPALLSSLASNLGTS